MRVSASVLRVGEPTGNQRDAPTDAGDGVTDQRPILVVVEQGRFAGGPGEDKPMRAAHEMPVEQSVERREIELLARVEGRDQRANAAVKLHRRDSPGTLPCYLRVPRATSILQPSIQPTRALRGATDIERKLSGRHCGGPAEEIAPAAPHPSRRRKLGCHLLESRLSTLGDDVAINLLLVGSWDAVAKFETAVRRIEREEGIRLLLQRTAAKDTQNAMLPYVVEVVAADKPGILHQLAEFFIAHTICPSRA